GPQEGSRGDDRPRLEPGHDRHADRHHPRHVQMGGERGADPRRRAGGARDGGGAAARTARGSLGPEGEAGAAGAELTALAGSAALGMWTILGPFGLVFVA